MYLHRERLMIELSACMTIYGYRLYIGCGGARNLEIEAGPDAPMPNLKQGEKYFALAGEIEAAGNHKVVQQTITHHCSTDYLY